jgi:diguanylate cyclase (GGDEF)-like protein
MKITIPDNYCGRILSDSYSLALQQRIFAVWTMLRQLDDSNIPAILYLSAWKKNEKIIWYEYIGTEMARLLNCNCRDMPQCFRDAIVERRVYSYGEQDKAKIREKILTREELRTDLGRLRQEVQKSGAMEAVYKMALPDGRILWLKDLARIEIHDQDGIFLSLGSLTDVSKEMEQKDLLEKIGYFDELTKLPKRKIMRRIMEICLGQFERGYIENFSFLMIDIDHFKNINDTWGHQAGDHVLAELAEVMMANKRKEDEIGRYGGEEFYAICIGSLDSGIDFADRLRRTIEGHDFSHEGQKISITISLGIAAASEFADKRIRNLISLADQRLYQAKNQGRNQVVGGKQ